MKSSNPQFNNSDPNSPLPDYNISFITNTLHASTHYHPCYKVILSLDSPFECMIDGEVPTGLRAIIINHDIVHSQFSPDTYYLVCLIKIDSFYGEQLKSTLADKAWLDVGPLLTDTMFDKILPDNYDQMSNETLIPHVNSFLDSIFSKPLSAKEPVTDKRILLMINYIENNIQDTFELEDIADTVHLSSERIRHLFSEKMYTSFTQYVLWNRVTKTMAVAIKEELKLANTCVMHGFSDQPHFNKAFRRIYGLSPASLIRENRVLL